jgi:hypothetical protein
LVSKLNIQNFTPEKGKSWKDLADLYEAELAKNPKDEHFKKALMQEVVMTLTQNYLKGEINDAQKALAAKFLEEYRHYNFTHLETNYLLLKSVKGYWADAKLKEYANWAAKEGEITYAQSKKRLLIAQKDKNLNPVDREFLPDDIRETDRLLTFVDKIKSL